MRRTIIIITAFLLCCLPGEGRKMPKAKTANAGTEYLDASFSVYDSMQKKIHSLAELGYMEYESSALLASHLKDNGFKVEEGVAGIPTAFVATFGSGSRSSKVVTVMAADIICLEPVLWPGQSQFRNGCLKDMSEQ